MHTEHKTLKWCAVLLALIIAIAAITLTALKTVPASAPVTVEVETIKAMPEEMADLTSDHNLEVMNEEVSNAGGEELKDEEPEVQAAAAAPVNVTIKVDGMEMHLMAAPATVKTALEAYGIPVGKDDIVKPAEDQQLTDDSEIIIQRIVFEEEVVSEEIPFRTKIEGTDELPAKTQKVVQKGQKGEDKVTYKVTYADGKEIARKEIKRDRVKKPVAKIIKKSTVGTINGAEYAKKFTVKAYSYTGGGTTASGLPAAVGRIAVDPRVIPLGTRVYVEGYGFATAADTGGNIKGNTIDVYYNSESQCRQWGCRYITIYILK
jgi:3D (Asp-Asp-Asp) domain-containing protein